MVFHEHIRVNMVKSYTIYLNEEGKLTAMWIFYVPENPLLSSTMCINRKDICRYTKIIRDSFIEINLSAPRIYNKYLALFYENDREIYDIIVGK